eukprot:484295_1
MNNVLNKTHNTNVTYKQSHHTNSSNTPINNQTSISGMNTSIDEEQALQEQLQQQQRQLILQSHQLKQLKTQIINQNENDVPIPPVPPPIASIKTIKNTNNKSK